MRQAAGHAAAAAAALTVAAVLLNRVHRWTHCVPSCADAAAIARTEPAAAAPTAVAAAALTVAATLDGEGRDRSDGPRPSE